MAEIEKTLAGRHVGCTQESQRVELEDE